MALVTFRVAGIPQTKGSASAAPFKRTRGPRAGKMGVRVFNDNPKAKAWAALVSAAARAAIGSGAILSGAVSISLTFYLPRPKAHYRPDGSVREAAPRHPIVRPDGDKLERCTWDALTRIAWGDDAQVVAWSGLKIYAGTDGPGVLVEVQEMD